MEAVNKIALFTKQNDRNLCVYTVICIVGKQMKIGNLRLGVENAADGKFAGRSSNKLYSSRLLLAAVQHSDTIMSSSVICQTSIRYL
jgi:hypothetical protein